MLPASAGWAEAAGLVSKAAAAAHDGRTDFYALAYVDPAAADGRFAPAPTDTLALSIIRHPRSLDYSTPSLSRLFDPLALSIILPLALSIIRPSCSLDYSTLLLSRLFDTLTLSIIRHPRSLDFGSLSLSRLFDTLALSII